MKTGIAKSHSIVRRAALLPAIVLIVSATAVSADVSRLSPAQASVAASRIAALKYPQERALASGWTDAKKVAEFMCRPLAMKVLKRRDKSADRVFLGTDDPGTLNLVSNRSLTGSGQVRTKSGWQTFTFTCGVDPRTGRAVSFQSTPTSPDAAPLPPWRRHFGPGPVRSPTFNPPNWPGQNRQPK